MVLAPVWLLVIAVLLTACAVMEPPPGGAVDMTRPHLVFMIPDSASTGLGTTDVLNLTFSEKMDRVSAVTWLHFFPDQRIRQTKWHGATRAEIILEYPLPADTVIVVEIAAGMKDAHRVKNRRGRRYPISTGDSIPTGRISGVLVMADSAVTNGVVELYNVPPDTLEYFQQDLLRRTVTDKTGAYSFDWLPNPGGPWLVRAYADANGDLRPGEKEAQRLLPDTLSLTSGVNESVAGVTTLYSHDAPGRLQVSPFTPAAYAGLTMAWTMKITDLDSGWVPIPTEQANIAWLDPTAESPVAEVKPGPNRLIVFVDVDGDSLFSGVPDSLLGALPDSLRTVMADSAVTHFLEPWLLVEGIEVVPGLDTEVRLTETAYSLTPWTPPPVPDLPDSLAAGVDSLLQVFQAEIDSTAGEPETNEAGE